MKTLLSTILTLLLLPACFAVGVNFGRPVLVLEYDYAPDGTLKSRTINGEVQNYRYDRMGRLLGIYEPSGKAVEEYRYDPAGNSLSKTVNGRTTYYSYDEANQLVWSKAGDRETRYEYDAAGRLVKEGGREYRYSYYDKLTSVREGGEELASFDYYVDGQLAAANYRNKTETFLWDGLALIGRNETSYLNEPYLTGGELALVQREAFGSSGAGAADEFFTGKPYVDELGYAFLCRNYRADQGKWQTSDPLGYPDGWNNFAYVNNWVTSCIDWLGAYILDNGQISDLAPGIYNYTGNTL